MTSRQSSQSSQSRQSRQSRVEHRHTFDNWARNHRAHPLALHRPRGDEQIVALVARARARAETIKAVGAGHSWTDIACTGGHLLSLDDDRDVLAVDRERATVTVRAGIRLAQLIQVLADNGLAFCNLGSVAEQSIAGAIATGTHGTGIRFGNLATQVVALRLVTGTGQVLDLSPTQEPELFSAARVGLGCLGIITQLTLQCEPAFNLHERGQAMGFERAMDDMDTRVDSHEHTKLWWLPHADRVLVSTFDRTSAPPSRTAAIQHRIEHHRLFGLLLDGVIGAGERLPGLIPAINRTVAPLYLRSSVDRVDRSDRVFNVAMPPRHMEMEYAIPRARAREAAERLRALIQAQRLRVNFIQELRFAAADDILMSPAFGRDSCHFGVYINNSADQPRLFALAEALFLELDGRPHWGKCFHIGHHELRARLPNFERFADIRRRLDPDGVFVNDFVRRVFGPA